MLCCGAANLGLLAERWRAMREVGKLRNFAWCADADGATIRRFSPITWSGQAGGSTNSSLHLACSEFIGAFANLCMDKQSASASPRTGCWCHGEERSSTVRCGGGRTRSQGMQAIAGKPRFDRDVQVLSRPGKGYWPAVGFTCGGRQTFCQAVGQRRS